MERDRHRINGAGRGNPPRPQSPAPAPAVPPELVAFVRDRLRVLEQERAETLERRNRHDRELGTLRATIDELEASAAPVAARLAELGQTVELRARELAHLERAAAAVDRAIAELQRIAAWKPAPAASSSTSRQMELGGRPAANPDRRGPGGFRR